jgi:hypothetical protein
MSVLPRDLGRRTRDSQSLRPPDPFGRRDAISTRFSSREAACAASVRSAYSEVAATTVARRAGRNTPDRGSAGNALTFSAGSLLHESFTVADYYLDPHFSIYARVPMHRNAQFARKGRCSRGPALEQAGDHERGGPAGRADHGSGSATTGVVSRAAVVLRICPALSADADAAAECDAQPLQESVEGDTEVDTCRTHLKSLLTFVVFHGIS